MSRRSIQLNKWIAKEGARCAVPHKATLKDGDALLQERGYAHTQARATGHYLPRLPRCRFPIRLELLQLGVRRGSDGLCRLCGLHLDSSPQDKKCRATTPLEARAPIRSRPKSYALADFFLYGYRPLPITAEQALVNARVAHDPYLTLLCLRVLVTQRDRSPAKLDPGPVGVMLSLAHPACPNGPPEALHALVEGAYTLLLAREDRLRIESLGGLNANVSECAHAISCTSEADTLKPSSSSSLRLPSP